MAAANLYVRPIDEALRWPTCAAIVDFPVDPEEAREKGDAMLRDLKPKALIAIEKPGANENGEYRSLGGGDSTPYVSKPDYMFEKARESGIFTVGIADLGNEIGSVKVKDTVIKELASVAEGGKVTFVTETETDVLIMSGTSNCGAWGIEACLAVILGRPEVLHDRDINLRVHEQCALAGGRNGPPMLLVPGTDMIPTYVHQALIDIMGFVVEKGLDYGVLSYPWLP